MLRIEVERTPIDEIKNPPMQTTRNRIYIKRDDLIPYSFGGNKVRIASKILEDMQKQGCDSLIIYGDRCSNMCRVLATACTSDGIPCLMVISPESSEHDSSFNWKIIRDTGIDTVQSKKNEVSDTVEYAVNKMLTQGHKPYYIFGNKYGKGNEAVLSSAYAEVYEEISEWERNNNIKFDRIAVPYGTGATMAGLVAGSICNGQNRNIVGISISSRSKQRAEEILLESIVEQLRQRGLTAPDNLNSHYQLLFSGESAEYGKYNSSIVTLIDEVYHATGIPMDPVYVGKAFYGLLDYLKEKDIQGETILFIHTGGLPLYFDYLDNKK